MSTLRKYDASPFVVCAVRPDRLDFRLANATFLKRISHSSHTLRTDNVRGSFLGNDILEEYEGIPNRVGNFELLLAIHSEFAWEENVARLVEATNAIVARATRFDPTNGELGIILDAPARAGIAMRSRLVQAAEGELTSIVEQCRDELLVTASIDNVNIRGNRIEQIITRTVPAHRLEDLSFDLSGGGRLMVDVKTKLLDRASAPKAYNIDKMLRTLAQPGSVFAFFFIGLDATRRIMFTRLVSIFDPIILRATRLQMHWAGRASRGVTQLTGDLTSLFAPDYQPSVSIDDGQRLLREFIGVAR